MKPQKPTPPMSSANAPRQSVQMQRTVVHQSTILDPEVLRKYSEFMPDAPQRVLAVFEANSKHERDLQTFALSAQASDNKRRDWLAFAVIIAGLGTSAVLAALDKSWLSGAALAAIISYGVFGLLQKRLPKETPA